MVLSLPVTIWATVAAVDVGFGLLVMLALAGAGAIVLLCVSSWSWYRLVIMPMLRELSGRVPVRPRNAGPGVSSPLLASIPALGFACGVGAVIIGSSPGTPWRTIDQRLFIAVGLSLPFIVPVALLLAHASVHPLAELIHAARRLHDGDYSARVPVLPGTEFDALGATLNEAMAGLAERARLAEDNAVLLEEIRASRARIVAAGDAERRRVERNIHDGAQQRLVALALELRMIEEEAAATGAATLASMAAEAGADLKAALDDLRELARGLHPAVLASDGIGPALEQAAVRVPVPVRVVAPAERYPEVVEATVYFVACEALANVAKHARATHAEVTVRRDGSCLVLSVADDGVGGAAPGGGSGLLGLGDRLAALDGTLTIDSAPDSGTRLVARLPIVTAAPC
jgi:signal transduction histidine kinase